jgi:maleate isomerase
VIDALEQALGRLMLTANQALLWGALRAANARVSVRGYGRLFGAGEPAGASDAS